MQQVLRIADAVAHNDCVVLIEGESGTGKELVARRIHRMSRRHEGPFIPVNCAGITESLFESQFYGHVRGAFTGAAQDTLGIVRAAEGGVLLLDEVGDLPLHLQPKLLRLLQQCEVRPVGASRPIVVDTRFLASTNHNLFQAVRAGTFRGDLYHRLNIVRIEVPPLRSRPEDVDPILDHYLDHYARKYKMPAPRLSSYLRDRLREYPWPGNVRELCAYVERLFAAGVPPMAPDLVAWPNADAGYTMHPVEPAPGRMPVVDHSPVCCTLAEAERRAIREALEATGYNRSAAARLLSIHRSTLLRKIRAWQLDPDVRDGA
jgi:transcriptional regulator with PAS, ATPase and Fis domain